jgi:hypothetical protein
LNSTSIPRMETEIFFVLLKSVLSPIAIKVTENHHLSSVNCLQFCLRVQYSFRRCILIN